MMFGFLASHIRKIPRETLKKRLAFVSEVVYPYYTGRPEKRLFEITTRLVKKGYDVHIYCMKQWEGGCDREESGVKLHGIYNSPSYPKERGSLQHALRFGLSCLKLLREPFDIIDVHDSSFFSLFTIKLVCLLKRKTMYATWYEVWDRKHWLEQLGPVGIVIHFLKMVSTFLPNIIISLSSLTTRRIRSIRKNKNAVVTIPTGVNLGRIQHIEPSRLTSDVIFGGSLQKHNNLDVLLRSIVILKKNHPSIKCLIIGDGPEKTNLILLSKSLGIEDCVEFRGSEEDLFAFMKSSKVFVLLSTHEGSGSVVLEANACGIPVITTNHADNAAKELINGENGRICSLKPEDIARNIEAYIHRRATPEKRALLMDIAKIFDFHAISNQLLRAYSLY